MITQASQYRYVVNPQPVASGIRGDILPVLDGGKKASVNSYEDMCYLVEMCRERIHWTSGYNDQGNPPVGMFSPKHLVDDKRVLDYLGWVRVHDRSFGDYDSSLVTPDWNGGGLAYPVFGTSWRDLYETWFGTMAMPPRSSVFPAPFSEDADTLRRLYYDYGSMKRYVFMSSQDVVKEEDVDTFERVPKHLLMVQNGKSINGGVEYGSATYPAYQTAWDGGAIVDTYTQLQANPMRLYVRSPFLKNPITNTAYYSSPHIYAAWDVGGDWYDSAGIGHGFGFDFIADMGTASMALSSAHSLYEGYCEVPVGSLPVVRLMYNTALSWAMSNVAGFSGASKRSLSVYLYYMFLDTGEIDHVSNLPSAWTWTPPQTQA